MKSNDLNPDLLANLFLARHDEQRAAISRRSRQAAGELATARQCGISAIVSYLKSVEGIKYEGDDKTAMQMALIAQFVQGLAITETAISDGLYPQASALLKQELETLVQLENIENDAFVAKRTPRIPNSSDLGRMYGHLNQVAHPSNAEIFKHFASYSDGDKNGPTYVPQFDPTAFEVLFDHHCLLILRMFIGMDRVFWRVMNLQPDQSEAALMLKAASIMQAKRAAN